MSLNLPKIHALTGCDTTSYFYRVGKIKVFKKLFGQQYLCFLLPELLNCSEITKNVNEDTKAFITAACYNESKKESYVNTRDKLYKVFKQQPSLTLSPDLDFVTQAIEKVNFQIKIWLQSLNQNMTFSSFEQNCWKWCDDKLIMVPIMV